MISLYERLRKSKVVVVDIETTGLVCDEEGRESDRILEIAAIRLEHLSPEETFHTYVSWPQPLAEEVTALTGITGEMLSGAPSVQEALEQFAAVAEGAVLVGYNLPFGCKFLDHYGAQCGVTFPADRVDLLPIAKRVLGKSVKDCRLQTVRNDFSYRAERAEELKTCMGRANAAADLAYLLSYLQRKQHNDTPMYRIVAQRRKIRHEILFADRWIAINLLRCALFGKSHPLFPLWVYKCAEKLEYVSRFVEYEVTDELCERVFAIYDAVRVSCMPYLLSRTETYHPDEYASIIIQAVETEGKNREIKIEYDSEKYKLYR